MKLNYEDLLFGHPIQVDGIGTFRSPQLKELSGMGMYTYNLFLSIFSWEKEDFLKHIPPSQVAIFSKNKTLNLFDMMAVLKDNFRDVLREGLSFFMLENVVWEKTENCFLAYRKEDTDFKSSVGRVDRDNFADVCSIILQINYMNKKEEQEPQFSNERARKRYEKMIERKKTIKSKPDDRFRLGNIVSKMSVAKVGYTLLNIWDLTIYQLYDAFSQYSYMRSTDLSEKIYSNHGGDKFRYEDWLKPINN